MGQSAKPRECDVGFCVGVAEVGDADVGDVVGAVGLGDGPGDGIEVGLGISVTVREQTVNKRKCCVCCKWHALLNCSRI